MRNDIPGRGTCVGNSFSASTSTFYIRGCEHITDTELQNGRIRSNVIVLEASENIASQAPPFSPGLVPVLPVSVHGIIILPVVEARNGRHP